jgi:hypothetical protein
MPTRLDQIRPILFGLLIALIGTSKAIADKVRIIPFNKVGAIQSNQGPIEVGLVHLESHMSTFFVMRFPLSDNLVEGSAIASVQIDPEQIPALMGILKSICDRLDKRCEPGSIRKQDQTPDLNAPSVSRYELASSISRQKLRDQPVDYWVSLLRNPDPAVRESATIVVMRAGPEAVLRCTPNGRLEGSSLQLEWQKMSR